MKKKLFIGLIILSVAFILGGVYITESINLVVGKLNNIIALHKVDYLREDLINKIKTVQTDLQLKGSRYSTNVDKFVEHGEKMEAAADICFDCHHEKPVQRDLEDLEEFIIDFQKKLSRVYTLRANQKRLLDERRDALAQGNKLMEKVNSLDINSSEKIAQRIDQAHGTITAIKYLVISFVTLGPILILLIFFYFAKRFSHSINALSRAISHIKSGDLTYQIEENLVDEFQELATAFNNMGISLEEQHRQLEEQHRQIESIQQRYRMLFESTGEGIMIMEAEGEEAGNIISANQAAADMHGYMVEEMQAINVRELYLPEDENQFSSYLQRLYNGESVNMTVNHLKKDGTVFPVEISAGLFEHEGHNYVFTFDRDITEKLQAEEALQRSRQMAVVGEMAAGLAHEIKNPLAGVKVSIEILTDELELEHEDKEVLVRVVQEINRMEKLLKNLLNYARPPRPVMEAVDVNELIENSVKNSQVTLRSPAYNSGKIKEIDFRTELATDLPRVMADSSQLQQVFLNIILNAVEAIEDKGVIEVKSYLKSETELTITITDNGKGMDREAIDRLFQPFYTTKSKGNGLGLSISRRLIEQHNGSIEVASEPDKGTTFTITLPLQEPDSSQKIQW